MHKIYVFETKIFIACCMLCVCKKVSEGKSKRASLCKVNGLPDWPLMAIIVEHMEGQRDLITSKSVSHLSDQAIKNVCKSQPPNSVL